MNKVELVAQRSAGEMQPLDSSSMMMVPVLTPVAFAVAGGLIAGAVVGYVDRARHGGSEVIAMPHQQPSVSGELDNLSVSELLHTRQDAMGS